MYLLDGEVEGTTVRAAAVPEGPSRGPFHNHMCEARAWILIDTSMEPLYSPLILFSKLVSQSLKHFVSTLHIIAFG